MGFHRGGRAWTPGPVFDLAFGLAASPARPRLCFITTGGGDSSSNIAGFYGAFAGTSVRASHLALFEMPNVDDVAAHLLAQDVNLGGPRQPGEPDRGMAAPRPR
jgi:hypothetical protein